MPWDQIEIIQLRRNHPTRESPQDLRKIPHGSVIISFQINLSHFAKKNGLGQIATAMSIDTDISDDRTLRANAYNRAAAKSSGMMQESMVSSRGRPSTEWMKGTGEKDPFLYSADKDWKEVVI